MMAVVGEGGKPAMTRYQVVAREEDRVWLRLWPETGRTHQLRVHLAHVGAPVLGDRLYGPGRPEVQRLMLHAYRIVLPAQDPFPQRTFMAPLPADFLGRERLLRMLQPGG
jgi:23S rRNA-/tRNA-specific pseudouridylate synthase